jgi:aminoglycoside phosphotransferase (APT) family kinase protein
VGLTVDAVPVSLEPERVASVLSPVLGDAVRVVEVRRLSAGASRLTWSVDVRSGGVLRRLVLQRERGQGLGRSEMLTEAALLRAAGAAGVPVPAVVAADDDPAALGGAYIVTERVDGETIPRRILRDPALARARAGFAAQCGEILTRVHAIPLGTLPDLPRPDPVDAIVEMLDNTGQSRPAFELGLVWLREHRPRQRRATLVHGDFRNGNLVVGPDGIRAVLDWELAHAGNPMQDLGWLCARPWRWGASSPVGGVGRVDELLSAYSPADVPVSAAELFWWKLLSSVSWGVMCLEQARVHLSGEQRSVELAVLGRLSSEMEYDVLRMVQDAQ